MVLTEVIQTDVLIVGGGGAASRAAYEAKRAEPGLSVTLVVDGRWGKSGSTTFIASEVHGINAPMNTAGDGDSPEVFFQDIMKTGLGIANPALAHIIAHESMDRIRELIDLGVKFDSSKGHVRQKKLSGCTKARSLARDGRTGVAIVRALRQAALKLGVQVIEDIRVLDLIQRDGEVWGVRGVSRDREICILAKAVVLATGGAGAIFPRNINPVSIRGDGFAMAYRAGAALTNMEFIQIGPGVVHPKMPFIIHSYMWNLHPRLKNRHGREFLNDYLPPGITLDEVFSLKSMSFPFSVRTAARYVDIAMSKEILAGSGTEHGGVFFDVTHVPENEFVLRAPVTFQNFLKRGINLTGEQVEIAPLVQSFNGGIKIDEDAKTGVEGLFAVGEVSGGVHGADRPGGNNLADCQVFGYRGGRAAAALASQRSGKFKGNIAGGNLIGQTKIKGLRSIWEMVDRALMVVRRKEMLENLLLRIHSFREVYLSLDRATDNSLLSTEMIARSALMRNESRGTHYREDFPESNPEYMKPSQICKGAEEIMTTSWA